MAAGLMLPYIVMEYVEGRTLRDILREGRRILPERALEITGSVLDALDYSHRAGIIHRDIKPANVMLTPHGDVKVMDFGIARAIADSSATMTQTAAVVGTAQYLSPEQARGEQVDARSDLYSTGLPAVRAAHRPAAVRRATRPVSVAYQHVREEAEAPSTIDREISPTIDAITLKALAKRVDERYQSASEMRADIERALDGRPVMAPAVYGAAAPKRPSISSRRPRPTPTAPPPRLGDAPRIDEEPEEAHRPVGHAAAPAGGSRDRGAASILSRQLLQGRPATADRGAERARADARRQAEQALTDANLVVGEKITENSQRRARRTGDPAEARHPARRVDEGTEIDLDHLGRRRRRTIVQDVTRHDAAAGDRSPRGARLRGRSDRGRQEHRGRRTVVTEQDPGRRHALAGRAATIDVYYSTGSDQRAERRRAGRRTRRRSSSRSSASRSVASNVVSDADKDKVVGQDPDGRHASSPTAPRSSSTSRSARPETTTTTPTGRPDRHDHDDADRRPRPRRPVTADRTRATRGARVVRSWRASVGRLGELERQRPVVRRELDRRVLARRSQPRLYGGWVYSR